MRTKHSILLILALLPFALPAQGLFPKYWDGADTDSDAEKQAKKACKCMHQTLVREGVDLSEYYEETPKILKDREKLDEEKYRNKWGATADPLRRAEGILFNIEEEDCYAKVMEKLPKTEQDQEEFEEALEKHCRVVQLVGE